MAVIKNLLRLAPILVATLLGALCSAPAAQAGPLVAEAKNCAPQPLSQPFARWLDPLYYTPVTGGSMEDGTPGWRLSGAVVVPGNEPYYVRSRTDSWALSLPPRSSAQTPVMCVGLDHLVMRFFVKSNRLALSVLKVEVLFEDAGGRVRALPVGLAFPNPRWSPSLPVPVVANLLPLLPGRRTPVAFRFTAIGAATWTIDDVYLDPRFRG